MNSEIAMAAVQAEIRARNPDLDVRLVGQVHHIRPAEIAFVDVYGCDDKVRRRAIRAFATDMLRVLGIHVELVCGHDVYTLDPGPIDRSTAEQLSRHLASVR